MILYLKRAERYGLLLPYQKYRSKKADYLETFTDSDWAGDKSSQVRRRRSVSSVCVFLNGYMVTSWSRSQKSIALSSCEAEFLASAGGVAEAIQVKDLWHFISRRAVMIKAITDSSSCRAFTERLGVGRLKHIDIKYLWMQLEVKKETLKMEGIPTLWNVSDLGTKRLSRQRLEFLMYLIGLMEMHSEGRDEVFTPVGEDAFNKEVEKRVLAKKMKEVKNEMVQAVFIIDGSYGTKIPTNLVRAVTLLLLHREVRREEVSVVRELPSGWAIFQILTLYTMVVFAFGVYIGYRYRMKISICFRTCCRFLRQEVTMEFQREQDLRDQVEMIMQASMAAGIGEWHPDPRIYDPLLPRSSGDEGEGVNEANPETRVWDDPNAEEPEESEPEAEQSQEENRERTWNFEWTGSWLTDWNPELGRLQEYRILEHSDDAESGEEYFMSNPLGGYQRRYRPSQSER